MRINRVKLALPNKGRIQRINTADDRAGDDTLDVKVFVFVAI
jgi:hypothetical protein